MPPISLRWQLRKTRAGTEAALRLCAAVDSGPIAHRIAQAPHPLALRPHDVCGGCKVGRFGCQRVVPARSRVARTRVDARHTRAPPGYRRCASP
jgi:hypothetical protein